MVQKLEINPITGKLDLVDLGSLPTYSSNPSSADSGQIILNTSNHTIYVYYDGNWQTLHTLSVVVNYLLKEDGDIILLETGDKIKI